MQGCRMTRAAIGHQTGFYRSWQPILGKHTKLPTPLFVGVWIHGVPNCSRRYHHHGFIDVKNVNYVSCHIDSISEQPPQQAFIDVSSESNLAIDLDYRYTTIKA